MRAFRKKLIPVNTPEMLFVMMKGVTEAIVDGFSISTFWIAEQLSVPSQGINRRESMLIDLHRIQVLSSSRRRNAAGVACLFVWMLSSSMLQAQQTGQARLFDRFAAPQTDAAIKSLPAPSQAVIQGLSKFSSIPISGWRYHPGNVTNGQSVTLDDSTWQEGRTVHRTDPTDIVWLRNWIDIPTTIGGYDLRDSRIEISVMVHAFGGDGATVFINGERIAQTDRSEPMIHINKPGDKVLLAIRIGKTPMPTNAPVAYMHIDFPEDRPNPEDLYTEFVTAALLLPTLGKDAPMANETLTKAIADVDLNALDANDQHKFDKSVREAQQDLEQLKHIMRDATFYLTGNSHIDAAWLWPWTETVDVVQRTFSTALELMDEYPTYIYAQSAAQYNEWMADKYPQINAEIKRRVQEGRWELVGGMWIEPDLNMPGGESLVRQLLVGQNVFKKLYGVTTRIGWNPDSFGYNWQLPQIYKKSGIDYFVTQKLAANETNPLPFKLFWWESPDGSKILAYFPHSYSNNNLSPVRLTNDLVKADTLAPGMVDMMDLYGVGDHGGGPTRAVLDQGANWMQPDKVAPNMKFATAQSFFSQVETKISSISPIWNYEAMGKSQPALPPPPAGEMTIPIWKDELYFEHHRGTYTTQASQKRNMRQSEEWMLDAEKYASLAWLEHQPYPNVELTEAWKKVLFNQFHDVAAGSGIGDVYKDAQRDYDQVRWATNEISTNALHMIQAHVNTRVAGAVPILVFNPVAWDRSGVVKVDIEMPTAAAGNISILDANNQVVPSKLLSTDSQTNTYQLMLLVKNVPSFGYKVLHAMQGTQSFASDLKASGTTIENAAVRVTVDPQTGCITSLYDKKANFEALATGACGNQLQTFKDTPITDDAWNIDPGTLDSFTPVTEIDSVQLVEDGPLRATIRVSRHWNKSNIVQDITLYANSDQVDIENDVDWQETHTLLKAAFPLSASSMKATYEIPYGSIERPTTRSNGWDGAKFEVPALQWADLGDGQHGFSWINNSKYGYDCKDNVLRLTLLRSPLSPDPNADRGHQYFSYSLYPHGSNWKEALTVRRGYEFNYELQAMQVEAHSGNLPSENSFIKVKESNVVLTAVKKAEDADGLILRFYEWAGKDGDVEIHVPTGATSATLTNLMEKSEGRALSITNSDRISVPVHPFEIVTVRVDYPHDR
jgi:alpha-mannosidase